MHGQGRERARDSVQKVAVRPSGRPTRMNAREVSLWRRRNVTAEPVCEPNAGRIMLAEVENVSDALSDELERERAEGGTCNTSPEDLCVGLRTKKEMSISVLPSLARGHGSLCFYIL